MQGLPASCGGARCGCCNSWHSRPGASCAAVPCAPALQQCPVDCTLPAKTPHFGEPHPLSSALQVPTRVAVGIKQVPTKVALGVKALADAEEDKSLIVGDVLPKPASE